MIITCQCGAGLQVPEEAVGKSVRCPTCQAVFTATADAPRRPATEEIQAMERPTPFFTEEAPPRRRDEEPDRDERDRPRRRDDDRKRGPTQTSGKALASLICGIAGFLCLPGIIGAILGIMALSDCNKNKNLGGRGMAVAGLVLSVVTAISSVLISILIALLVPAVQKVREAAARTQTTNNMKWVANASFSYHDTFKTFPSPTDSVFAQGQPGQLSWRASLLPFIEQAPMQAQLDFSQPWDSARNRPFLDRMPMAYESLWSPPTPDRTMTYFQLFVGPDTPFPDRSSTPTMGRSFPDGTSTTFLFAESATAVPWTKPADMNIPEPMFDGGRLRANLPPLPLPPRMFLAAMADGSVRMIDRSKVSDATIRLMICPNDGNPVPVNER